MIHVILDDSNDPYINLALDEVLLFSACNRLRTVPVVRIWINRESVIIGRSLKVEDEVNIKYVDYYRIPLIRRITGGGAVYHDLGNINLSLIASRSKRIRVEAVYREGLSILRRAIRELGLNPYIENINDLVVNGWKVSGSAAYVSSCASLFHATLLVDADIGMIQRLLKPRLDRVARGEVTPAKYRPRNLSDFIDVDVSGMIKLLLDAVSEVLGPYTYSSYHDSEHEAASLLVEYKYLMEEWNFHGKENPGIRKALSKIIAKSQVYS